MRIAVIGAGGLGGYYGGTLARAGHDVLLFARGDHLAAIRARGGLEIREPGKTSTVSLVASNDPSDLTPADLTVVAVKSYSLSGVAPVIRRLAEEGAIVLPLLNGVEAFESLVEAGVPTGQVVPGLTLISAARVAPGVVERKSDFQTIVIGETGGGASKRGERIAAAFRDAGADASVSEDIVVDLWRKFLFIATLSAACGLARSPIGAVRQAPLGRLLLERAAGEVGAVARARGIALPGGEEGRVLSRIDDLPAPMKPSFLLDLERGGPNELDILSGAVSRYGRTGAVATPVHDTATAALAAASAV